VFRRRDFFQGRPITGGEVKDIYWINPAGVEMQQSDWGTELHALGVLLVGEEISELDDRGRPIRGNSYLLLLNAGPDEVDVVLPARLAALEVEVVLDTTGQHQDGERVKDAYLMTSHSAAVLLVSRPAA